MRTGVLEKLGASSQKPKKRSLRPLKWQRIMRPNLGQCPPTDQPETDPVPKKKKKHKFKEQLKEISNGDVSSKW